MSDKMLVAVDLTNGQIIKPVEVSPLDKILADLQQKHGFTLPEKTEHTAAEWAQMQVDAYNKSAGNLNEFDGYNCNACLNKGYFCLHKRKRLRSTQRMQMYANTQNIAPCKAKRAWRYSCRQYF